MQETPILTKPALEEIILTPAECADATAVPIRDEEARPLLDELGLPICEG